MPTGSERRLNTISRNEHNTRAAQQWEIISRAVDFRGKRVIDLGCGYGDLVYRAMTADAEYVRGVDKDLSPIPERQLWDDERTLRASFELIDLDEFVAGGWGFTPPFDVAVCMSVLPYLRDLRAALGWMAARFPTSIIECQYWGDGPGPAFIRSDDDMRELLRRSWAYVEMLGGTFVKDRGAIRSIWLCEDQRGARPRKSLKEILLEFV